MYLNTEYKNHLFEQINNAYNFVSDIFFLSDFKYIVLINLLDYSFKIVKLDYNADLFFLNKYKILNKNCINSILNKKFIFKKNNSISNNYYNYKIEHHSCFSNYIPYKLEIKDNKINKIKASFNYYNTNTNFKELENTSFYMRHFFKFHLIEHFNIEDENKTRQTLKNLSLYLVNLIEHLEVFIKLLYYLNEKNYLKELLNTYNCLVFSLENLDFNNFNIIKETLNNFLSNNKILKYLKKTKKQLKKDILISKESAFYNSISGSISRASGLDIDFNISKDTVLGSLGSTYERFYIRYLDILRLINEILKIKNINFDTNIKSISKLNNKIVKYENSNGLVFSIIDYDQENDILYLKLHFSTINNINLLKYALDSKTPSFDYFLISLNLKHEELALNNTFIIKEATKNINHYLINH